MEGVQYHSWSAVCGRTLLLPQTIFDNFAHDTTICAKYEVPEYIVAGLQGIHKVRKLVDKHRGE